MSLMVLKAGRTLSTLVYKDDIYIRGRKEAQRTDECRLLKAGSQFENDYFTEMCSGSEAGSYLRLIFCVSLNSRRESNDEEE